MLANLHICNLGIIDDLEIEFEEGLNVLTGETGAGKTLIINSIYMILGNKVTKDIIRSGASKAFAEALFFVKDKKLRDELSKFGFDEDELIIYREISDTGRSVAKINGKLVTINELKEIGSLLVDLHGQHDNQSLLNVRRHIELLDNFAGDKLKKNKEEYLKLFEERETILNKIDKFGGNPEQRARTMEFLKFEIDEIEGAKLQENEEESLIEREKILANAERILSGLSSTYNAVSGEDGALFSLQLAIKRMESIENIDAKYADILRILREAYYQIEEGGYAVNREKDKIYIDEEEQNRVVERLDLIFKLKKKYGNSVADILGTLKKLNYEYEELYNSEKILQELSDDLKRTEDALTNEGENISKIRKETANILEKKLEIVLAELEMPKSKFLIRVDFDNNFSKNGMDSVEILFSSNLGETVKPLSKVASGGEISRIMLALKNILVNADILPVLIFDEIDTGISGEAGFAVGDKMREISESKQIICVTHLPSIAAKGMQNYFISKENLNGKTVTKVKKLKEEETLQEIARIISGGNITEIALAHAKEIRNMPKTLA